MALINQGHLGIAIDHFQLSPRHAAGETHDITGALFHVGSALRRILSDFFAGDGKCQHQTATPVQTHSIFEAIGTSWTTFPCLEVCSVQGLMVCPWTT